MAIQFRRGNEADLVAEQLLPAEPAYATDTKRLVVGTGEGAVTVPTEAQVASIVNSFMAQRIPVGTILMWPGTIAPAGTLILQGQLVNRADYPDLWQFAQNSGNLVSDAQWLTRKGSFSSGNGTTTFRLPDLRGRVPVGFDSSQTEFNTIGKSGGNKTVALTESQVPQKTWRLRAATGSDTVYAAFRTTGGQNITVVETATNSYAQGGTLSNLAATVQWSYGGGQAHNNLQPYTVVNYIIIAEAETTHGDIESALAELISQTQAARDNANQAAEAAHAAADAAVAVGKKTPDGGEIFNSYTGSAANRATALYSHAEGSYTTASGYASHAEGGGTTASGYYSHAEGGWTTAYGDVSHAEGSWTSASGENSHAEGQDTTASGLASHAEGSWTSASGDFSHAGGYGTIASAEAQTAIGKYNAEDTNALFIVGNGTYSSSSNAFTVKLDGSATVQTQGTSNNSVIIKSTLDTALAGKQSTSITDAGGYFTADTVEGALQEIGAQLSGLDEALEALL